MPSWPHNSSRNGAKPTARTGGTGRKGHVNHNAGVRTAKAKIKHEEAVARNAAWAEIKPAAQLQVLDGTFGKGKGATKQRARIAKALKV